MSVDFAASGWAAEQLTAFLAAVSGLTEEADVLRSAVEQAAEAVEAEVAVLVTDAGVRASVGYAQGRVPEARLRAVAHCNEPLVELPGLGRCAVFAGPIEGLPGGRLLLARVGEAVFDVEECNLLRGMARVLSLSLRGLSVLADERALREVSQRQATENAELVANLRERQALLERLTTILRAVSTRAPLPEVLQAIIACAADLLNVDVVGLRVNDAADPRMLELIGSSGLPPEIAHDVRRVPRGLGATGRAITEGRFVVIDDYQQRAVAHPEFAGLGMSATMAAPVHEDGVVVGALAVSTRRPGRRFTLAEQGILQALADHTSVALTDAKNVQALRAALEAAQHDAMHDALTALPNRALLRDRLSLALRHARRYRTELALLFLDLDGFKRVNDSLGHDAGDQLLRGVAGRLQGAVRDVDTLARLGGDEFAVLVEGLQDHDDADEVVERIFGALEEPFVVNGHEIKVTVSIGGARPRPDDAARDLLRNADLAMYEAKAAGKGRYVSFRASMLSEMRDRLDVESDLRRGLEAGQFAVHYQPIVNLETGEISQVEALLRWMHPQRGVIPPDEFIPVAEASGFINQLGDFVLRQSCAQAAWWQGNGLLGLSVNLSPGQVGPQLAAQVADVLRETGLAAERLTLEITEGFLNGDEPDSVAVLEAIQAMGVRISVDDFGTGYSSLSRLSRLPVNQLKIDRSFVRELPDDGPNTAIVSSVIALARGLGLSVVAEGVESDLQRDVLRAQGCDEAQGYLFGRPGPPSQINDLLSRGPTWLPGPRDAPDADTRDRPLASRTRRHVDESRWRRKRPVLP
ncbi:MAG TPA: EAL domain-containing protein [Mycobacteriales bacterium]|nr:EAL domain-containing protein [Mycobacteriales bacterium]